MSKSWPFERTVAILDPAVVEASRIFYDRELLVDMSNVSPEMREALDGLKQIRDEVKLLYEMTFVVFATRRTCRDLTLEEYHYLVDHPEMCMHIRTHLDIEHIDMSRLILKCLVHGFVRVIRFVMLQGWASILSFCTDMEARNVDVVMTTAIGTEFAAVYDRCPERTLVDTFERQYCPGTFVRYHGRCLSYG